jgi:mannose-6-phosphate isomerase-like protein (cupin superfamily)
MKAPAGWSEPGQNPSFDEYIVVLRGTLSLEIGDEKLIVSEGKSAIAPKESRVRFTNPFDKECEYIALCMPAFRPERVRREEE